MAAVLCGRCGIELLIGGAARPDASYVCEDCSAGNPPTLEDAAFLTDKSEAHRRRILVEVIIGIVGIVAGMVTFVVLGATGMLAVLPFTSFGISISVTGVGVGAILLAQKHRRIAKKSRDKAVRIIEMHERMGEA